MIISARPSPSIEACTTDTLTTAPFSCTFTGMLDNVMRRRTCQLISTTDTCLAFTLTSNPNEFSDSHIHASITQFWNAVKCENSSFPFTLTSTIATATCNRFSGQRTTHVISQGGTQWPSEITVEFNTCDDTSAVTYTTTPQSTPTTVPTTTTTTGSSCTISPSISIPSSQSRTSNSSPNTTTQGFTPTLPPTFASTQKNTTTPLMMTTTYSMISNTAVAETSISGPSGRGNIAAISGGVAGGVFLIMLFVAGLLVYRGRRAKKKNIGIIASLRQRYPLNLLCYNSAAQRMAHQQDVPHNEDDRSTLSSVQSIAWNPSKFVMPSSSSRNTTPESLSRPPGLSGDKAESRRSDSMHSTMSFYRPLLSWIDEPLNPQGDPEYTTEPNGEHMDPASSEYGGSLRTTMSHDARSSI